jgi:hypothetical protein
VCVCVSNYFYDKYHCLTDVIDPVVFSSSLADIYNSHEQYSSSLTSFLRQHTVNINDKHSRQIIYVLVTIDQEIQLKYWTNIQRSLEIQRYRAKVNKARDMLVFLSLFSIDIFTLSTF